MQRVRADFLCAEILQLQLPRCLSGFFPQCRRRLGNHDCVLGIPQRVYWRRIGYVHIHATTMRISNDPLGSISWTSLRGNDKYKLLKQLDVSKALLGGRAAATRALWVKFIAVYDAATEHRVLTEAEISDVEVW